MISETVLPAERAALGAALLDPIAADRMVDMLIAGDFLEPLHAKVFAAIASLALARQPIDLVTVRAILPPEIGFGFLSELMIGVSSAAFIVTHCKIIQAASCTRQIIQAAEELRRDCERAAIRPGVADELLAAFLERTEAIRNRLPSRAYQPLAKAEPDLLPRVEEDIPAPKGMETGFYELDCNRGILRDGEMAVLAARPSVGKSLFACNVAEHLAINNRTPVLVFSMEMSAASLYRRYLFSRSKVPQNVALAGEATQQQKFDLREAHANLELAPWYVHDEGAITAAKVHAISRRFQNKHGKGLIVVDYLQLMSGPGGSRYEVVTNLSAAMKALAVDLKCPVLVLAQLNRAVDRAHGRSDDVGIPVLSDLRDSGAIEQDADVVIFLARDVMNREPHQCTVVVAKNRPSVTGQVQLLFDTEGPRFKNILKVEHFR